MTPTRVRFAPSPTGFFHIGSARTALFNWLYARHTDGVFVLRIEDTDKQRNTAEALQVLLDGMRWMGMDWDEGPEVGGPFGPYFQSMRGDIYEKHLRILREKGLAYDKEGAVFFKISGEPQVIDDAVRGRVERTEEKDFVIIRSDGSPVFHFVNVVDDITMNITHVIRGEDHLSNTSKHLELFKAFEAPLPVYAHIPLILKSTGPGKMSKRDQGALIEDYQKRGCLPEAVRNYIALLGWSPKDDRELLTIDEIISLFDFPGIQKGNARFDEKKFDFINTEYMRQLPLEQFVTLARPHLEGPGALPEGIADEYVASVLGLAQPKLNSLQTIGEFTEYFFREDYPVDEKALGKVMKKGDPLARLAEMKAVLEGLPEADFTAAKLEQIIHGEIEKQGGKMGEYMPVLRLAVSGTNRGPDLFPMLATLGKQRVISRIEAFTTRQAGQTP